MLTSKKLKKPLLRSQAKERRIIKELQAPLTRRDYHHELDFQGPNRFETIFRHSQDIIFVVGVSDGRILHVSNAVRLYLGYEPAFLQGRYFYDLFPDEAEEPDRSALRDHDIAFDAVFPDQVFLTASGEQVLMDITATLIPWDFRNAVLMTIRGTEERRAAEKRQRDLIEELKLRLSQVKALSGLLPICSHCKRIRNSDGDWHTVEEFVGDRSEAEFTHSVCPTCIGEHYFELGIDFDE